MGEGDVVEGGGGRGKGDGNQRIEIGMAKRVSAESRERKAETELKAKHAKHDACQKLQVASCALSHAPPPSATPLPADSFQLYLSVC